jgi:hypothetical protein
VSGVFLLDANAFIQPKQKFYAFDICPGYWAALIAQQRLGAIASIDRVSDEIEDGGDDLWTWVSTDFPEAGFLPTNTPDVLANYARLQTWVATDAHYTAAAKQEFAEVENADGWLVAHAMTAPGTVIVTMEDFNDAKRNKVPIPNLATAFGIEPITPFEMLRRLGIQLR